jgi:hypothetical protein
LRGVKKFFEILQLLALARTPEAVVAYLHKTFGQDMQEKALDECFDWQCLGLPLAGVGGFVAKCDTPFFKPNETFVADGDAKI